MMDLHGSETSHNDSPSPTVTFTVDMLTVALLISSILYTFCLVLAQRKYSTLNRRNREMGTKKLLVLSVGLVCAVRIMTILGVVAMNIANVRAHYSLQPTDQYLSATTEVKNQKFYDKAMTVLFDLPNCIVVSTYALLTLVWAECFLESRFHTESTLEWKRSGLKCYMVFNALLYATQLVLYTCIFFVPSDKSVRTIIYAAITGINFTAVSIVLIFYLYLSVNFSGFPFRSQRLRESYSKLSRIMALWTLTRIVWGIATLLVYIYNIELLQDSNTPVWSFLVLLLLFFGCEIIPIIAMLDRSYMTFIGFDNGPTEGPLNYLSPIRPLHSALSQPLIDSTSLIQGDTEQNTQTN